MKKGKDEPNENSFIESKSPASDVMRGFHMGCLTVTYFHTGCGTIIGARAFHGPVRDGKGWDRPAMAVRH